MVIFNKIVKTLLFSLVLSSYSWSYAQECPNLVINQLISANIEPEGVVFELAAYESNAWNWASPKVDQLSKQLKDKYPNVDIAIISHGNEQFQLTSKNLAKNQYPVSLLDNLAKNGADIHVCGVNSSWNNVSHDSYIDIVQVAVSGPAKVNDYIKLGYQHIRLSKRCQD